MQKEELSRESRKRIEKVVNHVLKDLQGDLSLETLAGIANYSPYHFQKLFKQVMGESPKQYVIRIRLETAAHFLVIQKNKPVQVIAMDCGFSSPAVFSRAFKHYFEVSAEEFREHHLSQRVTLRKKPGHLKRLLDHARHDERAQIQKQFSINVKTLPVQYGICLNSDFDSIDKVEQALKELVTQASAHDLLAPGTKIMGIIYPHHNIYRAFIPVDRNMKIPAGINRVEIRAGKFACFKVKGNIHEVFEQLSLFYKNWLPENGYKLADIYGFEIFAENPVNKPYSKSQREIFVPIEPV